MRYEPGWDRPHQATSEPDWQESDCYWFFDATQGVGGFHRIGRHPNQQRGASMLFVFSAEQRFRRVEDHGASSCRVDHDAHQVGGHRAEALGEGGMQYAWSEKETEASLTWVESFYEPRDWLSGERAERLSERVRSNTGGHLECSGRIRGALRLGDQEVALDALAHRDRSWGVRDMRLPWQHRMASGTLGAELSFATFIMQLQDGSTHTAGFVARGDETRDVTGLRILTTIDYDGFSVAGGRVELDLADGDRLAIDAAAVSGFSSRALAEYVSTDHLCTFEHDGRHGFLDLEMANNPTRGTYHPKEGEVSRICVADGLEATRQGRKS